MKKIIALVCLLVVSVPGFAYDGTVNWVNATMDVNGTALPATGPSALKDTRIEWGSCNADSTFGVKAGELWFLAPATSGKIPGLVYGTKYCFRGFHRNNALEVSATSNVVVKLEPVPAPMPPNLSTTVNVVWREYSDGRFVLAGYVPMGKACDASRSVEKYGTRFNPVNMNDVTLFSGSKPTTGSYMGMCS